MFSSILSSSLVVSSGLSYGVSSKSKSIVSLSR